MDGGNKSIIVDMKGVKAAKGIEFNPGQGYNNSWPKKFEVFTAGADGVFASRGQFQGAFNAAANFTANCQFIQVKAIEGNMGNWWNIADFRVKK